MKIETKIASFHVEDIQTAYNDAVVSGRMALAREIEKLWIGALGNHRALRAEKARGYRPRHARTGTSLPECNGISGSGLLRLGIV